MEFVKERYSSFENEIGRKITSDSASLEELSAYAEKMGSVSLPSAGSQEKLLSIINSVMFGQ